MLGDPYDEAEAVIDALEAYEEALENGADLPPTANSAAPGAFSVPSEADHCEDIAPDMLESAAIETWEPKPGVLYLVSVPIGNKFDFSERALYLLRRVDYVASEEVQATRRLFSACGIKARLISYREAGRETSGANIINLLRQGRTVALVSGAGTPAVSDPGRDAADKCYQAGLQVSPIPGCSALAAAVACCGLPTRRFIFEGFLPNLAGKRAQFLESLKTESRTMFFYEAPHRLQETLQAMLSVFGNRPCFLGRELTKKYEECSRAYLADFVEKYAAQSPRGEFVIAVSGAEVDEGQQSESRQAQNQADVEFMQGLNLSAKEMAALLTYFRALPKNEAKRLAIKAQ